MREVVGTAWPQAIANNKRMVRVVRWNRPGTDEINLNCACPLWRRGFTLVRTLGACEPVADVKDCIGRYLGFGRRSVNESRITADRAKTQLATETSYSSNRCLSWAIVESDNP